MKMVLKSRHRPSAVVYGDSSIPNVSYSLSSMRVVRGKKMFSITHSDGPMIDYNRKSVGLAFRLR